MAKSRWEEVKAKLPLVEAWARDGLTDEQISHNLGINAATLYRYKNAHSEICKALKDGKEVIDYQVENALLKRAMGYEYSEATKELVEDPLTGENSLEVTKEVVKEVAPDVTAQIFWLKNRKPNAWRDKREITNINKNTSELSQEEIEKQLKELEK